MVRTLIQFFWDYDSLGRVFKCLQLNAKAERRKTYSSLVFFSVIQKLFFSIMQRLFFSPAGIAFRDECELHLRQNRLPLSCRLYGNF